MIAECLLSDEGGGDSQVVVMIVMRIDTNRKCVLLYVGDDGIEHNVGDDVGLNNANVEEPQKRSH